MNSRVTPELLEQLLDEHGAALELFASQWSTAPEDCVQEALLQLCRQPSIPDRIVPWLYRVVRNRAISQRRALLSRARHETAAASQRAAWFSPNEDSNIDVENLTATLRSMNQDHREVIVAKIWGGLTFDEVAEVIGISRSTAHRRYEEGLNELRERLKHPWLKNENPLGSMNSNAS